jgi:hypothetical protein
VSFALRSIFDQLSIFTAMHLIQFKTSKWLLEVSFVMSVRIWYHFYVDLGVREKKWLGHIEYYAMKK